MIRRHSQNCRPTEHPKAEATPSILAIRLQEAVERHRAKREPEPHVQVHVRTHERNP
jgi:hypothetical protein